MKIKIKPTAGGSTLEIVTRKEQSIAELKEEVSKSVDAPAAQLKLIYKGEPCNRPVCSCFKRGSLGSAWPGVFPW